MRQLCTRIDFVARTTTRLPQCFAPIHVMFFVTRNANQHAEGLHVLQTDSANSSAAVSIFAINHNGENPTMASELNACDLEEGHWPHKLTKVIWIKPTSIFGDKDPPSAFNCVVRLPWRGLVRWPR